MGTKFLSLLFAGLLLLQDVQGGSKGGSDVAAILASGIIISLLTDGYSGKGGGGGGGWAIGAPKIPLLASLRHAILPPYSGYQIPSLHRFSYTAARHPLLSPSRDVYGRFPHPFISSYRTSLPPKGVHLSPLQGRFRFSSPTSSENMLGGFHSHSLDEIYGQTPAIPFHPVDYFQPENNGLAQDDENHGPEASAPLPYYEEDPRSRYLLPRIMRHVVSRMLQRKEA